MDRLGSIGEAIGDAFDGARETAAAVESAAGDAFEAAVDAAGDAFANVGQAARGMSASDIGHAVLDVAGLVPGLGEPADLLNAAWYAAEGNHADAALAAASAVPFVGVAATVARRADDAVDLARAVSRSGDIAPAAARTDALPDWPGQLGGSYRDVKRSNANVSDYDSEVHHIPAASVSPLPRDDGPSIIMTRDDHRETASWGRSRDATAYRDEQRELIDAGRGDVAIQMDIDDIRGKFGDRYDDGIRQMLDYVDETRPFDPPAPRSDALPSAPPTDGTSPTGPPGA